MNEKVGFDMKLIYNPFQLLNLKNMYFKELLIFLYYFRLNQAENYLVREEK